MFVTAIIPAKMTSQRFKRKNIEELCGKPLLYYSIETAKNVKSISKVFVSSEDSDVLNISKKLGADIIIRPDNLSQPHITTQDVLKHAFTEIVHESGKVPDLVVLLQPTHPLRFPDIIDDAITVMSINEEFDSLFSVMLTDELRGEIVEGRFVPEFKLPRDKSKEPRMYRNTGSFYIFRPNRSFLTKSFFGKNIYPFILERSPFEVDIDYPSDMEIAKVLLDKNRAKFSHFKSKDSLEV